MMSDPLTQFLAVAVCIAFVAAVGVQILAIRMRGELQELSWEQPDDETGLFSRAAIPWRLEPELDWARHEGVPFSVAVFECRGGSVKDAAIALRGAMRDEEHACQIGWGKFCITLWNSTGRAASLAASRLGCIVARESGCVVEAGVASYPENGRTVASLVQIAEANLSGLDAVNPGERARDGVRYPKGLRSSMRVFKRAAFSGFPAFVVFAAWMWLRERVGGPDGIMPIAYSVPWGVCWGALGASTLVWSKGKSRWHTARYNVAKPEWRVILPIGVFLAAFAVAGGAGWGRSYDFVGGRFGDFAFMASMVCMVVLSTRSVVRATFGSLLFMTAFCVSIIALLVEWGNPLHTTLLLISAVFIGALLSSALERYVWLAIVAIMGSAIDVWSVLTGNGLTAVAERSTSTRTMHVLDAVTALAPSLPTRSPLPDVGLGATDFVFLACFLACAHLWYLPAGRIAVAFAVALISGFAVAVYLERSMPMIPFLTIAFFVATARFLIHDLRCLLIGPEKGTVPPGMRDVVPESGYRAPDDLEIDEQEKEALHG